MLRSSISLFFALAFFWTVALPAQLGAAGEQYGACFSSNGMSGQIRFVRSGGGFNAITANSRGKFERIGKSEFLYVYTYKGKPTTNLLALRVGAEGDVKILSSSEAKSLASMRGGLEIIKFRWQKC